MSTFHLDISNVCVKHGKHVILSIDNLQISQGQFVGIIGPNGAGKTTLLKLCCGLVSPVKGRIQFRGKELTNLNGWKKSNLRKSIGYVPQATEYNADLPFTLAEVVAMGRTGMKPILSRFDNRDYEQIDHWIDKLGLTKRRNQTFRSLSGGEQQKVLIARAMVQNPSVLMLDEPGANLDFNWKNQLRFLIDDLYKQTQITILMVTHEIELLPASCERIILVHKGKIIADGDTEKVLATEIMKKVYQCDVSVVDIAGQKFAVTRT